MKLSSILLLALVAMAAADVYMHNPRGSNNRLNENNQNRNNGNRLFDSQNNNRGGYNVGDENNANDGQGVMEFYSSSVLSIEWTNQHSSAGPNVHNEVVLQYMCSDQAAPFNTNGLRDGQNTDRVNNDNNNQGRHETADYYAACENRERNKGLFLADQNLNGDTAIYTRQNTNGDRNGYECPEEREYYPYWHPSSWKDVAVLTSEPSRCALYQSQSQNVLAKNYCTNTQFNNQATCEANGGTWAAAQPFGIAAPDCKEIGYSRDNHLGNSVGGQPLMYNWTLPATAANADCTLRLRYNITTGDYNGWDPAINASLNGNKSPITDNPTINFADADKAVVVKLALNTDQYGRTFQDRTHVFKVRARPANIPAAATLYNLNVRGRRGNIVQTYPSVEYDYAPSRLEVGSADYVHIQWTGSLNTPDGAGQGAGSTDRSNIIEMPNSNTNMPGQLAATSMFPNKATAVGAATVGKGANVNNELNNAPAYYNIAPFKPTAGVHTYMSTRNNNFTNRSQKGVLVVRA